MNAISLNNQWSYLQGISLTASNQRWLASHLMEAADNVEKKQHKSELVFPKIPKRLQTVSKGDGNDDTSRICTESKNSGGKHFFRLLFCQFGRISYICRCIIKKIS